MLIRHGETLWNRSTRIQGHTDIALSDLGLEQARRLGRTEAELLGIYPTLRAEDIVHAWAYVRAHRDEIEQQIRDNLIFTGVKVGELMQVAMDRKDAKEWFGAPPPDLTVITRSRSSGAGSGADWVYNYLRGFYRDSSRPTGWNNLVFENVGMPHVLWQLSGQNTLDKKEFASHEEAAAAVIAAKTLSRLDVVNTPGADGKVTPRYELRSIVPGTGLISTGEYDRQVADLVNYMNYMGEPARLTRRQIGIYALFTLGLLFVFAFALKKAFWKDVH